MLMSRRTPASARHRRTRARAPHARRGFTLLEVTVAALVLLSGLAGVAAATAAALRALAESRLEEDAATIAGRRIEMLRGTPCTERRGGVDTVGPLVERWQVVAHGGASATRLLVAVAPLARPARRRQFETVASC